MLHGFSLTKLCNVGWIMAIREDLAPTKCKQGTSSCRFRVCERKTLGVGLRSFQYKVVSIQEDSIQIEVVSRHYWSRLNTCTKSSRFNSIFRPVARAEAVGLEPPPPPRNFQIWIKFRYKSGILVAKMNSCQGCLENSDLENSDLENSDLRP